MPTVSKSGKNWRVQVRLVGYPPETKTLPKKSQAWEWGAQRERDLKSHRRGDYPKRTFREALVKFREEEAPKHKGGRWEIVRCKKLERDPIAERILGSLTDDDWALWRERELKKNSPATVRREMVLIGQVFETAREKWRWLPKNVMRDVKKPRVAKKRLPKPLQQPTIDAMIQALGRAHKSREVALGFLLGCETAMRPWEMQPLEKAQVAWRDCVAHLEDSKNGDERDIPLTPGAIEILAELDTLNPGERFFTVSQGSMTALWGEARKVAGVTGLHFRHSRREGIRRLSRRLGILDLARAVGHRDLNSLMVYYREDASELAKRLATPSHPPPSTEDGHPPRNTRAEENPGR
jgi:integrase